MRSRFGGLAHARTTMIRLHARPLTTQKLVHGRSRGGGGVVGGGGDGEFDGASAYRGNRFGPARRSETVGFVQHYYVVVLLATLTVRAGCNRSGAQALLRRHHGQRTDSDATEFKSKLKSKLCDPHFIIGGASWAVCSTYSSNPENSTQSCAVCGMCNI